jgi:cytochrome c oxidase subunit 2
MIQSVVWFTSLFFMLLIAAIFLWVAISARKKAEYAPVIKKWYKARKMYGTLLVILMLVVTIYTLRELPFNKPSHVAGADVVAVDVEAFQFGFELDQDEFKIGDTVEFNVTTRDVTHGFGIYNPEMEIIAQTQAMPDYTNTIYVTFDEPGTYEILCLEYCGLAHHVMTAKIVVTE